LGGLFGSLVRHPSVQEAHLAVEDVDLAPGGAGFLMDRCRILRAEMPIAVLVV